jgi:hypothetical protein
MNSRHGWFACQGRVSTPQQNRPRSCERGRERKKPRSCRCLQTWCAGGVRYRHTRVGHIRALCAGCDALATACKHVSRFHLARAPESEYASGNGGVVALPQDPIGRRSGRSERGFMMHITFAEQLGRYAGNAHGEVRPTFNDLPISRPDTEGPARPDAGGDTRPALRVPVRAS